MINRRNGVLPTLLCVLVIIAAGDPSPPPPLENTVPLPFRTNPTKYALYVAQHPSKQEYIEYTANYFITPVATVGDETDRSSPTCHNSTGACLATTYLCLNGVQVSHSDRCDGVEDCQDGSDEWLCHLEPTKPGYEHAPGSVHHRAFTEQFATATCNGCACPVGGESLVSIGNPYFDMALASKMTKEFSDEPPQGKRCNALYTTAMMMQLYKKSGFCRKAVCCVRQTACVQCNSTVVTAKPGKCWEKAEGSATVAASPTPM